LSVTIGVPMERHGRTVEEPRRACHISAASGRQRQAQNMAPWRATSRGEEERMRGAPWLRAARLSTSSGRLLMWLQA
jgi:hypothetical protein